MPNNECNYRIVLLQLFMFMKSTKQTHDIYYYSRRYSIMKHEIMMRIKLWLCVSMPRAANGIICVNQVEIYCRKIRKFSRVTNIFMLNYNKMEIFFEKSHVNQLISSVPLEKGKRTQKNRRENASTAEMAQMQKFLVSNGEGRVLFKTNLIRFAEKRYLIVAFINLSFKIH